MAADSNSDDGDGDHTNDGGDEGSSGGTSIPLSLVDALTDDPKTWSDAPGLISVSQVTPSGLSLLFRTARTMRHNVRTSGGDDRLKGKTLATVFYEASTRTACSFQAAMLRLGGNYEHTVGSGSDADADADLAKAVQRIESRSDAVVLRHPVRGSVGRVMLQTSTKPVINAGDGTGEHPTQALLDLFTICDELGVDISDGGGAAAAAAAGGSGSGSAETGTNSLVVVLLGDLKHGRTVHSLAKLLARAQAGLNRRIELRYVSPPALAMPQAVQHHVGRHHPNVTQRSFDRLDKDALGGADVLYVTRVQKERFDDPDEYEQVKGSYVVDRALMEAAPPRTIVMHPLPRVDEISTDLDDDPRAAYFRQMENGMYVRMAILALLLGKSRE